jgi:phage terminase large subunit GpA-like protein
MQVILGVDSVKADLATRLNVETPGPAYYHFPKAADGSDARGFTEEFFQQLTSEKCSFRYIRGVPKEEWVLETGKRNEAWDCAVYSFAALEDYAGFTKPHELLEQLAKDLLDTEPKKPIQYGVYKPEPPTPQQVSPTQQQQTEKHVPRWQTNRRTHTEFDPRTL